LERSTHSNGVGALCRIEFNRIVLSPTSNIDWYQRLFSPTVEIVSSRGVSHAHMISF
jgi:hypothetical protein